MLVVTLVLEGTFDKTRHDEKLLKAFVGCGTQFLLDPFVMILNL